MQSAGFQTARKFLDLSIKTKTGKPLERLGGMIVLANRAKVYWSDNKSPVEEGEADGEENAEDRHGVAAMGLNDEDTPPALGELLAQGNRGNEPRTKCATVTEETRMLLNDKNDKTTRILVSDDAEWWTMVPRALFYHPARSNETDLFPKMARNLGTCVRVESYLRQAFDTSGRNFIT